MQPPGRETEPDAAPRRPRRRAQKRGPATVTSREALAWLAGKPSLDDLVQQYPREWDRARTEIRELIERNDPDELQDCFRVASTPRRALPGARLPSTRELVLIEARRQMTVHLLKQAVLRSTTGIGHGRVRFGLLQGWVAQRLLFRRGLERKPVSMLRFRLTWPLLRQRRLLMPLVQPQGIWCFYSSSLIASLADLIGDRRCLEIAAGDGTLSRFLSQCGVDIVATDDHSWSDTISFPTEVRKLDARRALEEIEAEVVLCSWPPAGNTFERHVFTTPHVNTYVVIGSGSEVSTGDWVTYAQQSGFSMRRDAKLSRRVLPPELDHAVLVFQRVDHPAPRRIR